MRHVYVVCDICEAKPSKHLDLPDGLVRDRIILGTTTYFQVHKVECPSVGPQRRAKLDRLAGES